MRWWSHSTKFQPGRTSTTEILSTNTYPEGIVYMSPSDRRSMCLDCKACIRRSPPIPSTYHRGKGCMYQSPSSNTYPAGKAYTRSPDRQSKYQECTTYTRTSHWLQRTCRCDRACKPWSPLSLRKNLEDTASTTRASKHCPYSQKNCQNDTMNTPWSQALSTIQLGKC